VDVPVIVPAFGPVFVLVQFWAQVLLEKILAGMSHHNLQSTVRTQ